MLRYFIQQHPTFGSYKNPIQHKVEASLYFWWWLALTMNDEYSELCDKLKKGSVKAANERERQMLVVYGDFGDVRYEGGRHAAFASWWNDKVGVYKNGRKIRRGEYLFAEPQDSSVHYVRDAQYAKEVVDDDGYLLIAIPKVNDKAVVEQTLKLILDKHFEQRQGRDARNPKFSKAKYPPSSAKVPDALKKIFTLYEVKLRLLAEGKEVVAADLPEVAKIEMGERGYRDSPEQKLDAYDKRVSDAATVRRSLREANKMISNAAIGVFP
jgi:hypothetical protein